jgi:hypothetical protein
MRAEAIQALDRGEQSLADWQRLLETGTEEQVQREEWRRQALIRETSDYEGADLRSSLDPMEAAPQVRRAGTGVLQPDGLGEHGAGLIG